MHSGPSKAAEDAVVATVLRDLEPSQLVVHSKVGAAVVIGGLLSLAVCGQFGLGMTSWADTFNHSMHSHLGPIPCAVSCGVMFALFPVALLRLAFATPLQFRVLFRRHQVALFAWFAGFGALLAGFGEHGGSVLELSSWIVAALVAANLVALLMGALAPLWHPPKLLTRAGS